MRDRFEFGAQIRSEFLQFLAETRSDLELRTLPFGLNVTHLLRRRTLFEQQGYPIVEHETKWIPLQIRFASRYRKQPDTRRFKPTRLEGACLVLLTEDGDVFARRRSEMSMEIAHHSVRCSEFVPRESINSIFDAWCDTNGQLQLSEREWMTRVEGTANSAAWKHIGWQLRQRYLDPLGLSLEYVVSMLDVATAVIGGNTRVVLRTTNWERGRCAPFKFSLKAMNGRRTLPLNSDDDFEFAVVLIPRIGTRTLGTEPEMNETSDGGVFLFPKSFLTETGMLSTSEKLGVTTLYIFPPFLDVKDMFRARQDQQRAFYSSNAGEFWQLWEKLRKTGKRPFDGNSDSCRSAKVVEM